MKKIALLLAAVMVAAMVPATAFAKSDNNITNVATMKAGELTEDYSQPSLVIKADDAIATGAQFELVLDGATWTIPNGTADYAVGANWEDANAKYVLLSKTRLSVETKAALATGDEFVYDIYAKVTGDAATVTIDPVDSRVTAGTYTFAVTTSANATAKVDGMVNIEIEGSSEELEAIIVTETVANALKAGEKIKLRLYGNFAWDKTTLASEMQVVSTLTGLSVPGSRITWDGDDLCLEVVRPDALTKAGKLSITGIYIDTDGAKAGDVAEIVIKGAGVEATTLEVAKAVEYGVSFTVADKKLPVFYAGRKYTTDETLTVTFKELAEDSWWTARKTTLTFPEGVNVVKADIHDTKNMSAPTVKYDYNVVTLTGSEVTDGEKAEFKAEFVLSISPDFAGDITCTIGGPSLPEDMTVVVAEADYPVTFEVEVSDVSIDYRNVEVGDIVIKEAFAGALKQDTVLEFVADVIEFEGTAKVVVEEGDIEVKVTDNADGKLTLTVEDESYKTPAVVRLTNVEAYLHRALPAGSYNLKVSSNGKSLFENYSAKADIKDAYKAQATTDADWANFPVNKYTLADAYIEVVTAGRDQDDSTFTTAVKVTVGANTMTVGQAVVALDVPAYISNGYTMLPVRAVAEALSGAASTILWDDATKTVTIAFGARIISMTIGSKVMNINGVAIAMNAAPEVTSGRTFLPVRDLAYALGLTDADIVWDDATKTATLN